MEKKTKKNDYSRFYALLKQNPMLEKDEIVSQFTNGRTTHVSQMSRQEFIRMCDALQFGSPTEQRARELSLKRARSAALLRIGRLRIRRLTTGTASMLSWPIRRLPERSSTIWVWMSSTPSCASWSPSSGGAV